MKAIGTLLFVVAILVGIYVAVWFCVVGGIAQIIDGFTDPVNLWLVAFGAVRFLLAAVLGWATFIIGAIIASFFYNARK